MTHLHHRPPALACLAGVLALACAARAQEPKPKPLPPDLPAPSKPTPGTNDAPPASGASALVPGALPADTTPEARAAWKQLLDASVVAGVDAKPIKAFSARVDVVVTGEAVNSGKGEYAYLSPGFVRLRLDRSKVEHLRGPNGDFVVDAKGAHPLDRANKDDAQDLKQLDDFVAMAKNFLAFANPSALRLARVATLATPPAGPGTIGEELAARAKTLRWLEVQSPDFRLPNAAPSGKGDVASYRMRVGLDPATSLPSIALLDEARSGASSPALASTTLLLALDNWAAVDGRQLPKKLRVYEIDPATLGAGSKDPLAYRFRLDPSSDVMLVQPRIDPPLKPESFLAPR